MTQLTASERAEERRIESELRAVGMSWIGLQRYGPRYLYHVLAPDEHITGVAYGRYRPPDKAPAWQEGALVATDQRVLFMDRKPGFVRLDDIPYDSVAGVETVWGWPYGGVTVFTHGGVYALKHVSNRCRNRFVEYLEKRSLEKTS